MFALVSTDPNALLTDPEPVGSANDDYLRRVLYDMPRVTQIVCAWGGLPRALAEMPRVQHWTQELQRDSRSVCLGRTKTGHPRHPSRIGYATEVEPFGVP